MQQKLAGQCKIFAHLFAKFKQSFAEFNKKVFARSIRRVSGFHQEVLFSLNNMIRIILRVSPYWFVKPTNQTVVYPESIVYFYLFSKSLLVG